MSALKMPKTNEEIKDVYFEQKKIEFEVSCDNNEPNACFSLGEWYQLVKKDVLEASKIYEKNCFKNNHGNSCSNLARMYHYNHDKKTQIIDVAENEKLKQMKTDNERSTFLFKKGCEGGDNISCTAYSSIKLYDKKLSKSDFKYCLKTLEKMCLKENDEKACFKIGSLYFKPTLNVKKFMRKNDSKALDYLETSCDYGFVNACHNLAVMYKNGDGVEKDEKKFEDFKEKTESLRKQGENVGVLYF